MPKPMVPLWQPMLLHHTLAKHFASVSFVGPSNYYNYAAGLHLQLNAQCSEVQSCTEVSEHFQQGQQRQRK